MGSSMKERRVSSLVVAVISFLCSAGIFHPVSCQNVSNSPPPLDVTSVDYLISSMEESAVNGSYQNITEYISSNFDFCITDVEREKENAFKFDPKSRMLTDCSIAGKLELRLCSEGELETYFHYAALSLPIPDNVNCNFTWYGDACLPGFASNIDPFRRVGSGSVDPSKPIPVREQTASPCCPGFFCPEGLSCMIACPLGAYCPSPVNLDPDSGRCLPYAYSPAKGTGRVCGGADSWGVAGLNDHIFCPNGSFCPEPVRKLGCQSGHYCRKGSTSQSQCSLFSACPANSGTQDLHAVGFSLIVILGILLILIFTCSNRMMRIRLRRNALARMRAAAEARDRATALEGWRRARRVAKMAAKRARAKSAISSPSLRALGLKGRRRSGANRESVPDPLSLEEGEAGEVDADEHRDVLGPSRFKPAGGALPLQQAPYGTYGSAYDSNNTTEDITPNYTPGFDTGGGMTPEHHFVTPSLETPSEIPSPAVQHSPDLPSLGGPAFINQGRSRSGPLAVRQLSRRHIRSMGSMDLTDSSIFAADGRSGLSPLEIRWRPGMRFDEGNGHDPGGFSGDEETEIELYTQSRIMSSDIATPRIGQPQAYYVEGAANMFSSPEREEEQHRDLYRPREAPPVPLMGYDAADPVHRDSKSQVFKYAYAQLEREKQLAKRSMRHFEDLLTGPILESMQQEGDPLMPLIELEFHNLSMVLKKTGKRVLSGVTGRLMPGRLTAVMGPSGAGKTIFVSALAGKQTNCHMSGHIYVNGQEESVRAYKNSIGYVPQDDVVHGDLTVEENLWFSAKYRLPKNMLRRDKVLIVERTIMALGLDSVRQSLVGSVKSRGISGGQRKRVNVGMEMVMEPLLLIADEPTSGLDSTSSRLVVQALQREAMRGVNVVAVLHQPNYGIFRMFDDVMLLARKGRTVYLGPLEEMEQYFNILGFPVPQRMNPPDHYMDVLEGIVEPQDSEPGFDAEKLPLLWARYKGYIREEEGEDGDGEGENAAESPLFTPVPQKSPPAPPRQLYDPQEDENYVVVGAIRTESSFEPDEEAGPETMGDGGRFVSGQHGDDPRGSPLRVPAHQLGVQDTPLPATGGFGFARDVFDEVVNVAKLQLDTLREATTVEWNSSGRETPGFFRQYLLIIRRLVKQRLRDSSIQAQDYIILLLASAFLGFLSSTSDDKLGGITPYSNTILAFGLLVMLAALRTYSEDMITYWRESASGINRCAYFLAKDTVDLFNILLKPVVYLSMFYFFNNPRSTFYDNYFITLGLAYCSSGFAYIFAILMEPAAAQLAVAFFAPVVTLVGTTYKRTGIVRALYNMSFARWALEAYFIANAKRYAGVWLLTRCAMLKVLNYNLRNWWLCLTMLFSFGLVTRFLALICLILAHREKQR